MRLCNCSLRRFEKTFENSHWRKVIQMQPMWLCICSGRQLEKTFENSLWKKSRKSATNVTMHLFKHAVWQHLKTHSREQMQPMQLCIFSGRHFEKTFENSLRRKIVQMQPMQCDYEFVLAGNLRRHLKAHSGEKLFKFNQWDYEFVLAGSFRRHLKTHSWAQLRSAGTSQKSTAL